MSSSPVLTRRMRCGVPENSHEALVTCYAYGTITRVLTIFMDLKYNTEWIDLSPDTGHKLGVMLLGIYTHVAYWI